MQVYCLYVCSIFSCVPYFPCVVYIQAYVHFVRLQRFVVARFCPLQPLQPFAALQYFPIKKPSSLFAVPFARFASRSLLPYHLVTLCPLPFCRTFAAKHFQRSFYAVFKRFLSGLFVHAYLCTVCTV